MTEAFRRRTRSATGGCAVVLTAAAVLAAGLLVLVSLAVTEFFGRSAEPPKKPSAAAAAEVTRNSLEYAARDGDLSSEDIAHAARNGEWRTDTDATALRITVVYPATAGDTSARCYRFVVPLPLNSGTRVAPPRPGDGCDERPSPSPRAQRPHVDPSTTPKGSVT
ncbi:hypothetical protein AB0G74_29615 [Streptomyces sp. NPDC020875]|uniref:hypothetical protein n=1 Tax=Streptomyces sp. NPDC020875 TaxID=3154898 RepID=UPI0033F88CE8